MPIRPFRESDRSALLTLATEAFQKQSFAAAIERTFGQLADLEPERMIPDGVAAYLDRDPVGVFVAEEDGRILGFVITEALPERSTGWIPLLAVAEGHRRRGLGRALLEAALQRFREYGLKYARIETLATNESSQALFPQLGFREFAREIQYLKELDVIADCGLRIADCGNE